MPFGGGVHQNSKTCIVPSRPWLVCGASLSHAAGPLHWGTSRHHMNLTGLSVADLARRCREETLRFLRVLLFLKINDRDISASFGECNRHGPPNSTVAILVAGEVSGPRGKCLRVSPWQIMAEVRPQHRPQQ